MGRRSLKQRVIEIKISYFSKKELADWTHTFWVTFISRVIPGHLSSSYTRRRSSGLSKVLWVFQKWKFGRWERKRGKEIKINVTARKVSVEQNPVPFIMKSCPSKTIRQAILFTAAASQMTVSLSVYLSLSQSCDCERRVILVSVNLLKFLFPTNVFSKETPSQRMKNSMINGQWRRKKVCNSAESIALLSCKKRTSKDKLYAPSNRHTVIFLSVQVVLVFLHFRQKILFLHEIFLILKSHL